MIIAKRGAFVPRFKSSRSPGAESARIDNRGGTRTLYDHCPAFLTSRDTYPDRDRAGCLSREYRAALAPRIVNISHARRRAIIRWKGRWKEPRRHNGDTEG